MDFSSTICYIGTMDFSSSIFYIVHLSPISKHLDFIIINYKTSSYAILCCFHYLEIFSSVPHSQNTIYSTLNSRDHISYT